MDVNRTHGIVSHTAAVLPVPLMQLLLGLCLGPMKMARSFLRKDAFNGANTSVHAQLELVKWIALLFGVMMYMGNDEVRQHR